MEMFYNLNIVIPILSERIM